ncbi:MAG: metal-dependent phosphohydrolase [Segetibacter sp.]|jgi:HD superfamily phosphodiesterase|nr:metal-dependent phosphohydrolase [Segetibacter sp.]
MSYYGDILGNIKHYIEDLFNQYKVDCLLYHNLAHTRFVVERTKEIAANYSLQEPDFFVVSASAWFHDTGHLNGGLKFHEDRSVMIMKSYFEGKEVEKSVIDKIESCICATKFPAKPKSLLEEILCDADTYNLGTDAFIKTDDLLKKELQHRNVATDKWIEKTIQLLSTHTYFTPYCNQKLNKGKDRNIELLENQLQNQK